MGILFFVSAFFSEIIGTIAGFGSSTVFLPLALQFFDFKSALVLVAIFHIFGNIGRVSFFKSGLDRAFLVKFGLPSVLENSTYGNPGYWDKVYFRLAHHATACSVFKKLIH